MRAPIAPTVFKDYYFQHEWYYTDFIHSQDGVKEWPNHHCKETYLDSYPFISGFRTALDVGCRDGEFTRYLQHDFKHTYCFDPRRRPLFAYNADPERTTHFTCALGDDDVPIEMFGGTHDKNHDPAKRTTVPCYRLDQFGFTDVDYIKIDVEGFEKKVLIGALGIIVRDRPLIIIEQNGVTVDGEDQYAAKEYLERLGYDHVASCPRGWDFVMKYVGL